MEPPRPEKCPHCGYSTLGLRSNKCPECGASLDEQRNSLVVWLWRAFVVVMIIAMVILVLFGLGSHDDHSELPLALFLVPSAICGSAAFVRLFWRWGAKAAVPLGIIAGAVGSFIALVFWGVFAFVSGASP